MSTKNIEHKVMLDASPKKVYRALLDSTQHTEFTGATARISAKVGGAFNCYGNYIKGITLELEPDKRIVQAWRSRDWPKGHYSAVTFKLARMARGKTKLRFSQIGVPSGDYARKDQGWKTHYWEPLQRFLQSG
jgi:activator of HSP90 ATPase